MAGASGIASSKAGETGCGTIPSMRNARTTAGWRRSTLARQPPCSRYVTAALCPRGVTSTLRPGATAPSVTGPTVIVVVARSSSHTVHTA